MIWVAFRVAPDAVEAELDEVVLGAVPAPARAVPSSTRATTDTPAIPARTACRSARSLVIIGPRCACCDPGARASRASTANAATSITPATIPAVVRISRKLNRPNQIDSR